MTVGAVYAPVWRATPWGPAVTTPPAITGLRAAVNVYSAIQLKWDFIEGGTGIVVRRDGVIVGNLADGSTSFLDMGRTPATTYNYTVSATNAVGTSTAALAVTTTDTAPPQVISTLTQTFASATAYDIVMPTDAQPFDIILVQVARAGIGATTFPSASTDTWQNVGEMLGTTYGAISAFEYRVQPDTPITPFRPTWAAASVATVKVSVIRGAQIGRNNLYAETAGVLWAGGGYTAQTANTGVSQIPVTYAPASSGLMLVPMSHYSTAAVASPVVTPTGTQTVLSQPNAASNTIFSSLSGVQVNTIDDVLNFNYTMNITQYSSDLMIFYPEPLVTRLVRPLTTVITTTATHTTVTASLGTSSPSRGDIAIITVELPSGTGAVTMTGPAQWTTPVRVYDSTNTNPSVRTVVFESYATNHDNTVGANFVLTFPATSGSVVSAYTIRDALGDIVPTVATTISTLATDTVSTTVTSPTALIIAMAAVGYNVANQTQSVVPGFSKIVDMWNNTIASGMSYMRYGTSVNTILGHFTQMGEAKTGPVSWATTLSGVTGSVSRHLIELDSTNVRLGAATRPPLVKQFAAFGIPL